MTGCKNDRGPKILSSLMLWKPLFDLALSLRSRSFLVLPEKNEKNYKAILQEPN